MSLNDLPVEVQVIIMAFAGFYVAYLAFFKDKKAKETPLTFDQHTAIQISDLRQQVNRIEEKATNIEKDVQNIRDVVNQIKGTQ